jgi:hypothetical protein
MGKSDLQTHQAMMMHDSEAGMTSQSQSGMHVCTIALIAATARATSALCTPVRMQGCLCAQF